MIFILARRLTENEKEQIVSNFSTGKSLDDLSKDFKFTKLTISRNLIKILGEKKYKNLIEKNKSVTKELIENDKSISFENKSELHPNIQKENSSDEYFQASQFLEITPLNYEIDSALQKDLSSVPISEVSFPKVVYMIVDKKIELQIKYLYDYPDWQFLAKDELNRKTIEIFLDLKNAKRFCNKEQKVIKVPNTEIFKIVAPILLSRGISRIVSEDKLIAL